MVMPVLSGTRSNGFTPTTLPRQTLNTEVLLEEALERERSLQSRLD